MAETHFKNTQAAVNAIAHSKHPTNKIAACIHHANHNYTLALPNQWPPAIENAFGQEAKIGNSSGTIHAETACILTAPASTQNATLYITDPPCPNCMKNMAEAGITNIYIDHKGFDKDFARRRGHHFENMSMRIAQKAGINIYKINRKAENITPIFEAPTDYEPDNENPAYITKLDSQLPAAKLWSQKIEETKAIFGDEAFALCIAHNAQDEAYCIITRKHPTIGYTSETMESKCGKYSFIIQPLNRLLMNAARNGLTIQDGYIYTSRCPTSRELVNFIGATLGSLTIGNKKESRDEYGPAALKQLTDAKILNV